MSRSVWREGIRKKWHKAILGLEYNENEGEICSKSFIMSRTMRGDEKAVVSVGGIERSGPERRT